ncbi:MAG: hypothetical protein HQL24_05120 [Candidatus Omnitrophica bacterium]|nr:hypothetical protein [Candidatus Omnitrophota bacterium]
MDNNIEKDLGEQPIAGIMTELGIKSHDLVACSTEQITHKMVHKAIKGRRLTPNVKLKILNALNTFAAKNYSLKDIFNY